MKKYFLIPAIAIFGFIASASAQTTFGIRGAVNFSNVSNGNANSSLKSLVGYAGGILVEVPLGKEFALQPELDYTLKGTRATTQGVTLKENVSYITLPVLFKYTPSAVKGFNVFAGPDVSYLISAKEKYSGAQTGTTDFKSSLKNLDYGLEFGVGYDFIPSLGVDVRYDLGLANIIKDTSLGTVKNRTFQIGLRYLFGR